MTIPHPAGQYLGKILQPAVTKKQLAKKARSINDQIRLYNHDDVERFFLNAFITKLPYSTVNDLIDMTTYFDKSNIKLPEVLENNQRNCKNVNEYIKTYAELFEKYAIELITTDKQFPHYFPEWT